LVFPRVARVRVAVEDVEVREALTDIVVSPLADEPLINDKLADELEIAVESFGGLLGSRRRSSRGAEANRCFMHF
jgi:hypothetical protein